MSIAGRLFAFFPLLHLVLCLAGIVFCVSSRNALWLCWIIAFLYLFPPLAGRLHQLVYPLKEGRHRLDEPGYSPWWGTLQLQGLFNAVPSLEGVLRLIPGCYSAWLRLWGSRVGRGVVWTPRVEISDRGLLEIGDGVVFGHRVALYAHVVDRRRRGMILYIRRIRIGSGAFLGAGSRIGPGAVVAENIRLPILTDVGIGETIDDR